MTIFKPFKAIIALMAWLGWSFMGGSSAASTLATPLLFTDIDAPAARVYVNNESFESSISPQGLFQTTTTLPTHFIGTRFGTTATQPIGSRHLVMGFKRAIAIGTVVTANSEVTVSVLKPAAAYPGDPANENDWIKADRTVGAAVNPEMVADTQEYGAWVLPQVVSSRMIRFSKTVKDSDHWGMAGLSGVYVFSERFNNVAPQAAIYSSSNPSMAGAINNRVWEAFSGRWDNGAAGAANIISPANPEKLVFVWPTNVTLAGFAAHAPGFTDGKVQRFVGPPDHHPRDAADNEWETVKTFTGLPFTSFTEFRLSNIDFGAPATSRAFRIVIEKAADLGSISFGGKRVFVNEIMAMFPLGTADIRSSIVTRGCDLPAPIPLNFHLDKAGYVTLVIENAQGVRVRNLVAETFFEAGDHQVYWDGLDESGKVNIGIDSDYEIQGALVPQGNYSLRGLVRDELNLRYEFTVNASGTPPWPSSDFLGGWLSDHRPPSDIVYLPGSNEMMIVCESGEAGFPGIYVDLNGKKKSGIPPIEDGFYVASHLSQDRGPLADPAVITYSAIMSKNRLMVHAIDANKGFTRLVRLRTDDVDTGLAPTVIDGFAVYNRTALVSVMISNAITVIDTVTRKVTGTITVPSPRGMAFDSLGRLLVLSGNSLLRSTLPFVPAAPFTLGADTLINGSLDDPRRITVHAATGNLYISQWGNSHNVKVFTFLGPLIQPLRTIGDTGPLGVGPYNTNQMHNPAGVCISPDNKVWVTEYDMAPKRVSIWSLDGNLQKAFYGPPKYGGGGRLDPQDKTRFFYMDFDKDDPIPFYIGMEWKLNWEDGTSYLKNVYARWSTNNSDASLKLNPPETPVRMAGREYMVNTWNAFEVAGQTAGVGIWERVGDEIKMRGFFGYAPAWEKLMEAAFLAKVPPGFAVGECYVLWSDTNGDYRVQPAEITFRPGLASTYHIQPNLDLTTLTGLRVPLLGISPNGAPLYNLTTATNFGPVPPAHLTSGGGEIVQGSDGRYVLTGGPMRGYKDGKELWYYHSRWPSLHASHVTPNTTIPNPPGLMIGTTRLLGPQFAPNSGEAGEVWAINGNKGNIYLMTTDGLFVGTLFHDSRDHGGWHMSSLARNGLLNDLTLDEESFWPSITKTDDGNIYLVAGKNHSAIIRLEGLESVRRIPAIPFTVTAGQLAACVQYQVELAACQINNNPEHMFVQIGTVAPTLDGNLAEWPSTNFVAIDNKATGAIQVANGKLYAAWSTESASIADNTGLQPNALFKTGGALDLMIGADPSAPFNRPAAVLGDMRLIIARVNGATKALLYRQVSASGAPVTFTSPVRSLDIAQIQDVSASVQFAGSGGKFEISIPLATLGLTPADGLVIKGDIGVLRGINGAVAQRSYWHNEAAGLVNDTPSEAELEPSLWGRWEFHGLAGAPINITTAAALPDGQLASAYSQTFAANGGTGAFTWSLVAGNLPLGLALSALGGLTGLPLLPGNYSFTLRATDAGAATLDKAFTLKINALALNISTATLPGGLVGTPYTSTLALSGGLAPFTWSLNTGTLPAGLNISSAGVISGTPAAPGTFNFQIKLIDLALATVTRPFSITVLQPLAIATVSPLTAGKSGVAYSLTLSATGGAGGNAWTISAGALPAGLTLATSGLLSGTPTVHGNFSFTIRVADSAGAVQTKPVTLAIAPPSLAITTASPLPNGTQNSSYSLTLAATGGAGGNSWTLSSGTLPPGLNLSAAGLLNGTPTAAGAFNFAIRVTDSAAVSDTRAVSVTIAPPPLAIVQSSPVAAQTGVPYNFNFTATGGAGGNAWTISAGALPAGLALATSGVLSGTPTVNGNFSFTVRVADSAGAVQTKPVTLAIAPAALAIATPSPLPNGTQNSSYSLTFAATGGAGGNSWTLSSGTLPPGLNLSAAGLLNGTPTAAGAFNFAIRVTDSAAVSDTRAVSVTIAPPLLAIVQFSPIAAAQTGAPYNFTFTATGGAGGNVWTISAGALPAGLTINSQGLVSGAPSVAGTFLFTARVTDSANTTKGRSFSITVTPGAFSITTANPLPSAAMGSPYSVNLDATGGSGGNTWSLASGTLPSGLNLSPAGALAGVPTIFGDFAIAAQVTDSASASATKTFNLSIAPPPLQITTASPLTGGQVGLDFLFNFAATGGTGAKLWSLKEGALPGGLFLSGDGSLGGVPVQSGNFTFTLEVLDPSSDVDTATFDLQIAPPGLAILTTSLANATLASPYNASLVASGGVPPYSWAIISDSAPPAGLTMSSSGEFTGAPTEFGTFNFTVQATDSASLSVARAVSIEVLNPLRITSSPAFKAAKAFPFAQQLAATGGTPPYAWSLLSGALPAGIALNGSGLLSGSAKSESPAAFTVLVTDSLSAAATQEISIDIPGPLAFATETLPGGTIASPYSQSLQTTGGLSAITFAVTAGSLPPGLDLNSTNGALSGIPTLTGDFPFTATALDSTFQFVSRNYSIQVLLTPLAVASSTLPNGSRNDPYTQKLAATGGLPPYFWTLQEGSLPPGLNISSSGAVFGVPSTEGTFEFTIAASDRLLTNAAQSITLTIAPSAIVIQSDTLAIATSPQLASNPVNLGLVRALAAAGGVAPYTWTLAAGFLPPGCAIAASGNLVGTPNTVGDYGFTVRVKDAAQNILYKDFRIAINPGNPSTVGGGALPLAIAAEPYTALVTASGGIPPFKWSVSSGAFPTGLSVISSLGSTGLVTGIPQALGAFEFSLAVTDSLNKTAILNYTLAITNNPLVIATPALPSAETTIPYARALLALKGVPPYAWSIASGELPAGLALSSGGALTGTPAAPGLFNFTVNVSDQVNSNATQAFFIDVSGAAALSPRDTWRSQQFAPDAAPETTADDADPDGDGFVNLVEYALGLDPNVPTTAAQRPTPQVQVIEGKKYLTLTYTKAVGATDVIVLIETTDAVGPAATWTANIVEVTRSGDGVETITVRDTVSLDEAAARFLRLTVQPEPTSP